MIQPDCPATSELADIVSEPLVYPSRSGLKVAAYWDHQRCDFEGCPFIVMTPKYGETKKNNLQLGYLLAANGMNVVRFDHTCHVGESAGPKTVFSFERGLEDLLGTLDHLEAHFGVASASVLASSLSARTAIRAAAQDPRIQQLITVVGVVNVGGTLQAIYREDVVGNFLAGKRWGLTDSFFGLEADWDVFLEAACRLGLHDLEGTARDLATIKAPVTFFCGDDDAWVDYAEVVRIAARTPRGRVELLTGAKHEVRENHMAAARAFQGIVATAVGESWGLATAPETLRQPVPRSLFAQNRIERERLREAMPRNHTETDFWTHYLGKYVMLEQVDAFAAYLDVVGDLAGPLAPGECVLDAGCGSGLFGVWLLRRLKQAPAADLPALYVGLDLTQKGLADASHRHAGIIADGLRRAGGETGRSMDTFFARADFDRLGEPGEGAAMARFPDGTFDVVCCSLVLSYLKEPGRLLAELRRVLRKGGRLVVSSMKPFCDVSTIYREFVDGRDSMAEVESARNLLSGVGQIRIKEEQGHYRFFSGENLAAMAAEAGFRETQVYSSFGDQAVLVRALA